MRFQHLEHLLVLGFLPLIIVLFVWMIVWRRAKLRALGEDRLISSQIRGYIPGRVTLKFVLLSVAFLAIGIGWANLQKGDKLQKVQRKGVDVVIALDLSKSMLAKDVQPDRLTRAKQLVTRMIDKMQNDRVALVVFAGRAYLQVPLTIDYSAMKMMLQNAKPSLIPTQGTVIAEAITMAQKSFSQKERKYKALVVISDGEGHDDNALAAAKDAADAGVKIHTVGVGSPQGSTLYDPESNSVKLDEAGQPVVSKLNEEELKSVAAAGGGSYTLLTNTDAAADKLIELIEGMEQRTVKGENVEYMTYNSFFQYFLLAGLLALIIEWLLPGAGKKKEVAAI
ncbi:MAG: VWA domain-containing protein [Flavipsychrobacter sp.]|nr:VWA domain-containing protein [Flavipsychrobacter sp.]